MKAYYYSIIFLIFITPVSSHSRPAGYNGRCNLVVCKNDTNISISPDTIGKARRIGIYVLLPPEPVAPLATFETREPPQQAPALSVVTRPEAPRRVVSPETPTAPTATTGDTTAEQKQPTTGGTPSGSGGAANSASMAPTATPTSNLTGDNPVIGGMVYSDEADKDDSDKDADVDAPENSPGLNNRTAASDPGGKIKKSAANSLPAVSGSRGATGGGSPFGNYEGGKGGVKSASAGNSKDGAQGELDKMDKGYFGADGGRGKRGKRRRSRSSRYSKGRKLASLDKKKLKGFNAKGHLQSRFLRMLASSGQLGDKNTSMFYSMCHHYSAYAKAHNIKMGKTKCPPKK